MGTVNFTLPFTTSVDDFNFPYLQNYPFLGSNIPSLPAYGVFISQLIRYARASFSYECFILRAVATFSNKLLGQGYVKERFRSSLRKFLLSVRGSHQTIRGHPLPNITRHSEWWPSTVTPSIDQTLNQFLTLLLMWTLLPNLTFYLITRGFHRSFTTGAACRQRTLTPPDPWSCLTLGLENVLMLRSISPQPVFFPDFWVWNIPRLLLFFLLRISFLFSLFRKGQFLVSASSFYISTTSWVSLLVDQRVPEGTCSQVLRSTSVDSYRLRASMFSALKLIEIVILWVYYTTSFGFNFVAWEQFCFIWKTSVLRKSTATFSTLYLDVFVLGWQTQLCF